jgi:hypothetical protein
VVLHARHGDDAFGRGVEFRTDLGHLRLHVRDELGELDRAGTCL